MTDPDFDFYFEIAGRTGAQGAIAPAEQFFEGSMAEVSLAREIGQNSIDAHAGEDPVTIRFDLRTMATDDVPGISTLREHFEWVADETEGSEGNERMVGAREASKLPTIAVLKISDFGTTGLSGSESRDSTKSGLSALTRGAGISANDGSRGGSFGIGSAVGPMSSNLCTVLYTSLSRVDNRVVFAGHSRLASHKDSSGTWRNADGFYTDLNNTEDFRYLRDPEAIGPFECRTEPGTDIFVLGYRKADDEHLHNLRDAFLTEFLVAIHRGTLVVEGSGGGEEWRLDTNTLKDHLAGKPEVQAFYTAIRDEDPVVRESDRFGKMSLYINVDDTLTRSLHTQTIRKPLMKIDVFRHNSIPAKYAAILECSDDVGNKLLRTLEPPQHDRWDPKRGENGEAALRELKQFVREGLKSRVKEQLGETVQIKGLARYLPAQDLTVGKDAVGNVPSAGDGDTTESSTVSGRPDENQTSKAHTKRSVNVTIQTSAGPDGTQPTGKGKDRGGGGKRETREPGFPGTGDSGDGNSKIDKGQIRFRSWSNLGGRSMTLTLSSPEDVVGDLELVAIGVGGSVEDDYVLPIAGVDLMDQLEPTTLSWSNNVISSVPLSAGKRTRIILHFESTHRYRLDIK